MTEADFLMAVVRRADCHILLDLNNIVVNHKTTVAWVGGVSCRRSIWTV